MQQLYLKNLTYFLNLTSEFRRTDIQNLHHKLLVNIEICFLTFFYGTFVHLGFQIRKLINSEEKIYF